MIAVVNSLWGFPQIRIKWQAFTTESKNIDSLCFIPTLPFFFFNFVVLSLKCVYAFLWPTYYHHRRNPSAFIPNLYEGLFPKSLQKWFSYSFSYSCDFRSEVSLSLAPGRWRHHVPPTRLNKLIILCGAINQMTAIWAALSVKAWKLLKWGLDVLYIRFTVYSIL